ncbi:MAG: hypothetical protein QM479_02280 [Pseudomonadota bacterium]
MIVNNDIIINHLQSKDQTLTIKNLYQEKFNPLLTKAERISYYQSSFDSSQLNNDIKQLIEAESLLLIFPTGGLIEFVTRTCV